MTDLHNITGKKILVTGASGFIGSQLCKRLQELECAVHGITRIERPDFQDGIIWWRSDLSNFLGVLKIVDSVKPDIVYHLSSYVTGSRSPDAVLPTFTSNLVSTVHLLAALSRIGCERIVLAGSMEEPKIHEGKWNSVSPYAASKWASSVYGRLYHILYNLPVVVLQIFMVYGPYQTDLTKLIPYVTISLLKDEAPKVTSGEREVDWIYVGDVVDALITSAQALGIEGRTVEIGSGKLIKVREIVEKLIALISPKGRAEFGALADRPFEGVRAADASGTYWVMGWKTKTDIDEGLKRTVSWYSQQLRAGTISQLANNVDNGTEGA